MQKSSDIGSRVLLILSAILLGVCAGHWADGFYARSVHTHLVCQPTHVIASEATGLPASQVPPPNYPAVYEYDCFGN